MKIFHCFMLVSCVLALVGCMPAAGTNDTTNDTWRLDEMARRDTPSADFAHSVERYYEAIEKQDWPTTYDLRTSEFKQDVIRSTYLQQIAADREHLTSYKILNVRMYSGMSGGYTAAEIIMEFHEGGMVSYSSVRWKMRDGKWLCDEPGLSGFLTRTRIPDWITRVAGANRRCRCGCKPRRESAVAQLFSLGIITRHAKQIVSLVFGARRFYHRRDWLCCHLLD